jgi:Zn-finger nucleic acid-binding protein
MALQCPSCRTDMQESVTRQVTIDSCEKCGGAWFDEGELARVFTGQDVAAALLIFQVKEPVELLCPRCHKSMQRIGFPGNPLLMEQCTACRGLWVTPDDIPNIQALLSRSQRAARRPPPAIPLDARVKVQGGHTAPDDNDPETVAIDVLELVAENLPSKADAS